MAQAAVIPRRPPIWLRLFYLVPVFGWIARDTAEKGQDNLYYGIALIVSLWVISAMTFGIPGLVIPALSAVPFLFLMLILITWG